MTAEFALLLPAVVVIVGLVMSALAWGGAHLRAHDLASMAARAAAVEGDDEARTAVAQVESGAALSLSRSGNWVSATVSLDSVAWLPAADARVTARAEP